jgi:phosphomannomutase
MGGRMMSALLAHLPLDAIECYFEPDGSFPNHEPNPLLPENREFIVDKVRSEQADLGIAFDGDADRCFFVDETGEFIPGDFVTALLAASVLEREPGATIIYDVRASWAVPDTVEAAGGTALINRVGHAFIKQRMREVDSAFAGEVSGHYYFRDFYQADAGSIPALLMLELVSMRSQPVSEILAPFREKYFLTGEINTRVDDVALKLQQVKEQFGADQEISHLDGVSITAADWHLNVRPSNTEPLLRLNLEARSAALMESMRNEVLALLEA